MFTIYKNKFELFRSINLPSNLLNTVKLDKSEITRTTRITTTTTTQVFLKTASAIPARGKKNACYDLIKPKPMLEKFRNSVL